MGLTPAEHQSEPDFTGKRAAGSIDVETLCGAEWDALAVRFDDVNAEQTNTFCEARWGADRVENVLVRENGHVLGGATILSFRLPATPYGVAMIKWGPLWRPIGGAPDSAHFAKLIDGLRTEFGDRRGQFLAIMPHADPDHGSVIVERLQSMNFVPGWNLPDPDRYLVNVAISPDELRQSLDQKWRYNLKKAQKNNFEIEQVEGEAGYARFMELYNQMISRKKFHDTSAVDTLPALMNSPIAELRPRIVLVSHEGTPTAGAVIDVSGDRAVYLYGATDQRALRLKAGYALHWWIAERLCANPAYKWYDLGGTDGDQGLHQFKKGFVGKEGAIHPIPPYYTYAKSASIRLAGNMIFRLRDAKGFASDHWHDLKSVLRK